MQLLKLHVSASVSSFFLSLSFSAFQTLQLYSLLYKVHKYTGKLGKEPVVVRDLIGQTIVSIKNEACVIIYLARFLEIGAAPSKLECFCLIRPSFH